jgi:hypothetical protein
MRLSDCDGSQRGDTLAPDGLPRLIDKEQHQATVPMGKRVPNTENALV